MEVINIFWGGHATIWHGKCEILINSSQTRCLKCEAHQKGLHSLLSRIENASNTDQSAPNSHVNYKELETRETHVLDLESGKFSQTSSMLMQVLRTIHTSLSTSRNVSCVSNEHTINVWYATDKVIVPRSVKVIQMKSFGACLWHGKDASWMQQMC